MSAHAGGSTTRDDHATSKTPWILLWAFLTLIWSIFTPPQWTFAARVLLFQPLWGVRIWLHDIAWAQDLALFLSLHSLYSYWTGAWRFLTIADFTWIDINDPVLWLYIKIFSLLGGCGVLAGGIVHRGHQIKSTEQNGDVLGHTIDEELLPPLLITSQTSHSRIFPRKHAFSYPYLLVGIPVGVRGHISRALSVDSRQPSWFDVSSEDFLARGRSQSGLAEKLRRYLHTQGVTDRDYAFAYLVTAPRFVGYSFNPVSFWYLYDSDTVLKYMILEVNNTFDERRIYLLRPEGAKQHTGIDDISDTDSEAEGSKRMIFTETWEKDFHVSPFNSRKGSYSLRAVDPLAAYQESGYVKIDNTIVLRSSKESAKLVARVRSQGAPQDATTITRTQLAKFIASWWWVGLLTFPRIVWEAQKLFFQRKLDVWYRPEVTKASLGRNFTDDEKHLEKFFHAFLEDAVAHVGKPLRVVYEPAHSGGEEIVMYSPGFTYEEDHQRTLSLKVITPAFYSRYVHYAHAKEALDRESLATDEKNRTMIIEQPNLLHMLFEAMSRTSAPDKHTDNLGRLEQLRWTCLQRLRCPPPDASYPNLSDHAVSDIRSFGQSELDRFARNRHTDSDSYRRIVTKAFLAARFAFGTPALVSGVDWILRALLILAAMRYTDLAEPLDIFRPRQVGVEDVWAASSTLMLANSVHIWSLLKG